MTIAPEQTETQYREFEIRKVNEEQRTVTGIAVPYGETIDLMGFKERFEKGAFSEGPTDVPLFYGHEHRTNGGTPIGKVIEGRETDEGYEVTAHISKTSRGDEVYTLLRDQVIKNFSIGFDPIESRMEDDVLVRTAAKFREVSVTPFPAYQTAKVAEVRSRDDNKEKEKKMTTEVIDTSKEVADLRDTVTDLERRLAVLGEEREQSSGGSQFRTAGEILKALATNDENARAEFRAFGDTTDANVVRPAWIQRPLKFVQEKRPIVNLFQKAPLPSMGNSVEYPQVSAASGTVEKQTAEGAALAYMEVSLGTETATVGTYGGYSSLSRQAIERSDQAYLDAVLRYQAIQYAKATNLAVRNEVVNLTGTGAVTVASNTAGGWIDAIVDSLGAIEDDSLGLGGEFLMVSRDVFKDIMGIEDTAGRPVFALNGDGQNSIGAGSITRFSANIAGLPVVLASGLAADTAIVASSEAITVLESPGAPFRLQDESVINLTKDFSLYGYLAVTVNDPLGVVKLTLPA